MKYEQKFSTQTNMSDIYKGGPGDNYLGGGLVDTSSWFQHVDILEEQIKNQDIWFCSAPFQLLYTDTRGNLFPCSWAYDQHDDLVNIRDKTIIDYFVHDEKLNKMRKEMTTPNSDLTVCKDVCRNCIKQEALYGRSRRQASLKIQTNDIGIWPGIRDAVRIFKETGKGRITNRIFEMQIKAFGNVCNLDCYMCMPYDSTTREKTMTSESLETQNVFIGRSIEPAQSPKRQNQYKFIDQIVELAPYIRNLKLIGGEPLMMKMFYELFDRIIETGHSKEIFVKYQTNMSSLSLQGHNLLDYIPKFEMFEFTVSLDGYGKYNNYIRRKSDWDTIIENIKRVKDFPNVQVNINGTISFLSVLRFYKLVEWCEENEDWIEQVNWSNIRNPEKLQANILPYELKQELIPKYEKFPDIQNVLKESNYGIDYQDTLNYLLMMDKFYKGTKWDWNLFDVYPELKQYYLQKDLHDKLHEQGLI